MGDFFDTNSLRGATRGLSASSENLFGKGGLSLDTASNNVGKLTSSAAQSADLFSGGSKLPSIAQKTPFGALPTGGAAQPVGGLVENSSNPNSGATNPDTLATDPNNWAHNVLSSLQQPTYHIKLFMTDDQPFKVSSFGSYAALAEFITKEKKATVIAESGVTGLNIQSLEIDSVMGPNRLSRSTNAKTFNMKIFEPGGVAFMDILTDTAVELGVKDYSKVHYYLEISFMGYSEDGSMVFNPCTSFNNAGKWLYAVMITNFDVDVGESGSTYTLRLHPVDSQIALSENVAFPAQIAPEGSTLGAMADDLSKKLTESMKFMYGYEFHTFKIELQKFKFDGVEYDPATFSISPMDKELSDRKNVKMDAAGDTVRGQFPSGFKLNDAIEIMFSNSETVQQLAKGVMKQHDLDDYGNKFRESVIFRTNFYGEIRTYDEITNNYLIDYTIVVTPYFTELPILSKVQLKKVDSQQVQRENADKLRKAGFLAKKYDYLFSGTNTEVLEFDLSYNANWVALLPKALGLSYSNETNAPQDLLKSADKIKYLKDEILKDQQVLREHQQINTQIQVLNDAPKTPERDSALEKLKQEKSELPSEAELTNTIGANKRAMDSELANNQAPKLGTPRTQLKYAEEVHRATSETPQKQALPISTAQSPRDTRAWPNGSFPDQHHRDRTILGAVFDQMYDTVGSALQNITMKIKGDPYWLGPGGLQQVWNNICLKHLDLMATGPSEWQDYNKGDALFLVYFRYPRGVDDFGAPVFKPQDFFTGAYAVKTVTHSFSDGVFTQKIDAIRQPLFDIYKAFGPVENKDSGDASKPSEIPGSNITPGAIAKPIAQVQDKVKVF